MELEQKQSAKQRLIEKAPKIIIIILLMALIGLAVKFSASLIEKQKKEQEIISLKAEISRLNDEIKNSVSDKETAILKEKDSCKALRIEDEERIAAFAKQADKCIPIMKRFGVKY